MNQELRKILFSLLILTSLTAFLFRGSCVKSNVPFSNDGPFGVTASQWYSVDIGQPRWVDTHWIGMNGGVQPAGISEFFHLLFRHPMDFIEAAAAIIMTFLLWLVGSYLHKYTKENRRFVVMTVVWSLLMYQGMVFLFRAVMFIIYAK